MIPKNQNSNFSVTDASGKAVRNYVIVSKVSKYCYEMQ